MEYKQCSIGIVIGRNFISDVSTSSSGSSPVAYKFECLRVTSLSTPFHT